MSRLLCSILVLLAGASLAPGAAAGEVEAGPVLRRIEEAASTVTTVKSDFLQEKHLAIFENVLVSKGKFTLEKPDRLRWELTEPVESGFMMAGERGRRWHSRGGVVEDFTAREAPVLKVVAGQLLAWAKADFEGLRKMYRITVVNEDPATIRLEPDSAGLGAAIEYLVVTFAAGEKHIRTVKIQERDGDSTTLDFTDTVVNEPVPQGLFDW